MMNGCGVARTASKLHDDNLDCTFMRVYFYLEFSISEVESFPNGRDEICRSKPMFGVCGAVMFDMMWGWGDLEDFAP